MMIVLPLSIVPQPGLKAQLAVVEVIKAGVKKVIKAVDLKIQRLQNETIWLQNAQKVLENAMSKLKLEEISGWVEKQRNLYKDYYEELYKVKLVISYYQRIKDIGEKQILLVEEYKKAWNLFRQDKHFSPAELNFMAKVYSGILNESAENLDQLLLVVNSFKTQMSDAKRLEIINAAADQADIIYYDLKEFNQQNMILSLQRAKAQNDVEAVKKLYGF
jgi:hypothetical protein